MNGVLAILRTRGLMFFHVARQIRRHVWVHVAAGVVAVTMIVGVGGGFFYYLFRFLVSQEPFGPPLMERLMAIVLLTFFSMLIFSNLIITLTTTYISRETEFLMALPLGYSTTFGVKFAESIFFSSWAFVVLSLPLFASYGLAKHAPGWFYPAAFLLGFPFLVIPASIGALVTMILSAYFPARKARIFTIVLLGTSLGLTAVLVRLMGLRPMLLTTQDFAEIMRTLNAGMLPVLPNAWLARGLQAASQGQVREALYWFACLLSTALVSVEVCMACVPRLYYRGWALARESANRSSLRLRFSFFRIFDTAFSLFPQPVKALLAKDMRTFWRDPAQWSQLVILFGLLVVYVANIRGLSRQLRGIEVFFAQWRVVLSLFNMGATCFVLSILTTRFIYPMLSLEGKQYWVIGLAPFSKAVLVWEKFGLCLVSSWSIALPLMIFSNTTLGVSPTIAVLSIITVAILAVGLTSLAVGFGAAFPSFKEDNPARIANGYGGTMNIVASLVYVTLTIALEVPLALQLDAIGGQHRSDLRVWMEAIRRTLPFVLTLVAVNIIVCVAPIGLGIRRWLRHEFHF